MIQEKKSGKKKAWTEEECVRYLRISYVNRWNEYFHGHITFVYVLRVFSNWNALFESVDRSEWHYFGKMVTNTINYTYLKGYILKLNRTSTCLPFSRLFLPLSLEFCLLICLYAFQIGSNCWWCWKKESPDQKGRWILKETSRKRMWFQGTNQCSKQKDGRFSKNTSPKDTTLNQKCHNKKSKIVIKPKTAHVLHTNLIRFPFYFYFLFVRFHLNSLYDYYYWQY